MVALAAFTCLLARAHQSIAQDYSLTDLHNNVARIEVVLRNGEIREGFALAVAEYLNGILFVAPNTLVRDLEVPDNPTKKVSIRYFSSWRIADESTLLENSNARRNVALILAPARLLNRGVVWNSQGCPQDVAPGAQARFIGVDRKWEISPKGRVLTAFSNDRATAKINGANNSAIGSPVLSGTGIIGIIEAMTGDTVRIIDLNAIESTVREWALPWTLAPFGLCRRAQVPMNELVTSLDGLPELVSRLYRPGVSYGDILTHMKPTDSDLAAIFERVSVPAVRAHYQEILQDFSDNTVTHYGSGDVTINRCVDIPSGYKGEAVLTGPHWRRHAINTKTATRNCSIKLGMTTYKSFWFVNGHWIWLPTH